MKDFLWKFGPALLGIVSALIGGGIGGLVPMAIAGVAAVVIGVVAQRAWQNFKYDSAHKQQEQDAVKDHAEAIKKQEAQAKKDAEAYEQHKKNKEEAFKNN